MSRLLPLLHPVPVVLIGTKVAGEVQRANFTTIGDIAIAGLNPPLVMLSLHEKHLSRECIDNEGRFSLHVPEAEMVAKVDYCGMVSGHDTDKAALFDYDWHHSVPVIRSMPITLFCEVVHRAQIAQRVIYVARVIENLLREDVDAKDFSNLRTILYGLDNQYCTSGPVIGRGYHEGKSALPERGRG